MLDNSNDPAILKLKDLNKNMYQHLLEIDDPEEFALMKQIEEMDLNERGGKNWGAEGEEDYGEDEEGSGYQQEKEIKEPYPGLPANKKCKCGSG